MSENGFKLSKVSKEELEEIKKELDKKQDKNLWKAQNKLKKSKAKKTVTRQLDETEQDYLWNKYGYKHIITEDGKLIKIFKKRNVIKKDE